MCTVLNSLSQQNVAFGEILDDVFCLAFTNITFPKVYLTTGHK